jgi:hypothetical protein
VHIGVVINSGKVRTARPTNRVCASMTDRCYTKSEFTTPFIVLVRAGGRKFVEFDLEVE